MGTESNTEFAKELRENNLNVSMVGDCTSVGYIEGAISDARIAVKEIV
jgi:coenzyme F420-reducing hydrogenase gamma subunit